MIHRQRLSPGLIAVTCAAFLVASPPARPQVQEIFEPVNEDAASYAGDHVSAHALQTSGGQPTGGGTLQRYRVFLPADPDAMPAGGWPVLIHFELANFTSSDEYTVINANATMPRFSKFLALVLQQNIAAVITATATPTGNHPPSPWMPDASEQPGEGRFHPPGQTACFDYFSPDADCAEKDAVMLIQHVREHAGDPTSMPDYMKHLDRTRIAVHGSSAGAIALMWIAFGPDRRDLFDTATTGWDGQYDRPTRPDIAILREGAVWWPAPLQTLSGLHFSDASTCAEADLLLNVRDTTLQESSALFYDHGSIPTFLYYKEMFNLPDPVTPTNTCLGATGVCTLHDDSQENIHSALHGMLWWSRHPANTVLALATSGLGTLAVPTPAPVHQKALEALEGAGVIASAANPPACIIEIDPGADPKNAPNPEIVQWLEAQFEALLPNPWTVSWQVIRQGSPPPPGVPPTVFGPNGVLDPGCNVLLPISSAPAGTLVQVWISGWPTTLADTGCGEVIVDPELVINLQADGNGRLTHAIRWADMPSPVANVFQVIVFDGQAPCGFSIADTWVADTQLGS